MREVGQSPNWRNFGMRPHSAAYPWALAASALLLVLLRVSLPVAAAWVFDVALVGPVMLLVGVPHGALDHLLSAAVAWIDPTWGPPGLYSRSTVQSGARKFFPASPFGEPRFFVWYLGLCASYVVAWWAQPLWSSLLFAVLTAWHFGETDVEALCAEGAMDAQSSAALLVTMAHEPSVMAANSSVRGNGAAGFATDPSAAEIGRSYRRALIAAVHRLLYGSCLLMSLLMFDRDETAFQLHALLGDGTGDTPQVIISGSEEDAASADAKTRGVSASRGAHVVAQLAAALWAIPQPVWLAAAVALSAPPLLATVRAAAPPAGAWRRWSGFVALLLACAVAGRIGGIAVPFCAYFGGWHSMQALAHVGSVVSREQLEAQGWGSWAARFLPRQAVYRSLIVVAACWPRAAALLPREAFKARSSAASEDEGTLELSPTAAGPPGSQLPDDSGRSDAGAATAGDREPAGGAAVALSSGVAAVDLESGSLRKIEPSTMLTSNTQVLHKAGTFSLWLNTVPLSVGAFLFLLPLSLLLPNKASSLSETQSPVPPVLLVLLAVLTLPHAQIMHASYGAYADLTAKLSASTQRKT